MAKLNPFRFSTKYDDDETDLVYYGYRYYNPSTGRWLNRDPLGEDAGGSLYEFVSNDGIGQIDPNGLSALTFTSDGEYYFDGHLFGYDSTGSASGKQNSSSAYFSQSASENNCHGGLCNSGGTGTSSSFVKASVNNTGCPVNCTCTVKWNGSSTVYSRHKVGGFFADSTILGQHFHHVVKPVNASDGHSPTPVWVASDAGSDSFSATVGAGTTQLYFGYISVAVPPNTPGFPGNGFSAGMSGSCSCK
jgi:RHS repeat-associated protein